MFRLHVEYERLIYKPTTFSKSRKNYSDSRNCNHCEKNYLSNYLGLMTKYNVSNITCQTDFILGGGGSKITAHGDCSYEIKRRLLLGRKVMTNLDSILKSRDLLCQQRSISSRLWFFQWSCMDVKVGLWRKLSTDELMLLNCGVGEDSWESLGLQGDPTSPS